MELDPIEQKKLKLFQTVDELMEGQAEQQKLAFDLLNSQGKKQCFIENQIIRRINLIHFLSSMSMKLL